MSNVYEKFQALREKYPDAIDSINTEQERVGALLKAQEFANRDETKQLVSLCRSRVATLRKRLATDRTLLFNMNAQVEIWALIDASTAMLDLVAPDFAGELEAISAQLDRDLAA